MNKIRKTIERYEKRKNVELPDLSDDAVKGYNYI
jgi:hypothetical protein